MPTPDPMPTSPAVEPSPSAAPPTFRPAAAPGQWAAVPVLAYKQDGASPFRGVTRQVLFAAPELAAELRYFEVAPGGHTTLERHQHVHAVIVHRGAGRCLVGESVREIAVGDLVFIPPMTWHQLRAGPDQPLGFLCMVNADRDRPQLPTEAERVALRQHAAIAAFLDGEPA